MSVYKCLRACVHVGKEVQKNRIAIRGGVIIPIIVKLVSWRTLLFHVLKYIHGLVLCYCCCSNLYLIHTAALRFCRRIVRLQDEFFNRYIIRNNLFSPIVKTLMANGQRYNLVNSAIIEFFKFITTVSNNYYLQQS